MVEGLRFESDLASSLKPERPVIVEGICTTRNADGTFNVAPMGPIVDPSLTSFLFRPFQSSTTFANLQATGCGVFHITDDVQLIAQAAVGKVDPRPEMFAAHSIDGAVLADCCRWYEFRVTSVDASASRTEIQTEVVHVGRVRDFFGFNRAKHAVLEAAILATRLHLLTPDDVNAQLERLKVMVEKTAGPKEQAAFEFLQQRIAGVLSQASVSP
ncbi:DUF447 domain-containing protein [Planctomicrobium piriforme]|uniref:DUF447 family protein n=1 Tax=Planctomicrobium piriforme TaxID=1576369 RepID=A0A1I3SDH1_9PLAN|nr:DUF447 domain-containing protein [Planctomicrobium piriforme]SFJ55591.1 hypothetical protein SAMN05421753_12375 [Planctomicrobium piriforme]